MTLTSERDLKASLRAGVTATVEPGTRGDWDIGELQLPDDYRLVSAPGLTLHGSLNLGDDNTLTDVVLRDGLVDGVYIDPRRVRNFHLNRVRLIGPFPDEALSISHSGIDANTPPCRGRITGGGCYGCDKTMLIDGTTTKVGVAPKIIIDIEDYEFLECRQRCPRVGINSSVTMKRSKVMVSADGSHGSYLYGGQFYLSDCHYDGPLTRHAIWINRALPHVFEENNNNWGSLIPIRYVDHV